MPFGIAKSTAVKSLAVFLQQQRRRSETSTFMHFFAHWGGLGLVPLAMLDSSLIPTFGSLDVLVAFLSARQGDLWLYYASMATLGAVIGSYLTYRLGQKMGHGWMQRKFGRRRSLQVEYALEHWGVGAIFVSTVAPPPFPTSVVLFSAGTFNYNLRKFLGAVFSGRAIRYGLLSSIAAHYGRTIVRYMRHPGQHLWLSLSVTFFIVLLTLGFLILSRKTPQAEVGQATVSPGLQPARVSR
jgi:membrane protein YqaA with SNARE-associated domain